MTLSDLLYILFISPLESVMALVLEWARLHISELGFAILFLSLIVNIALLPIYYIAEKWQKEERLKQSKMSAKLAEIRQVFRGQERFAMISTLYRQNHYHPLMAVRSSFGLLIQIPFFFAAYHLLSHYEGLNGHSFGLISDLGQPDSLLQVGSVSIHLLPVLMTIISLGSAYLYADELTKSAKLQLYGLALIFLVVLYDSPSGLLVYWTFNNIFSLFKNLIHWFFKNRTLGWFTKLHEYVIKEREVSYFSVSLPFLKQASGQSRSLTLPTSFLIHIGVALLLLAAYQQLFGIFSLQGKNHLFAMVTSPVVLWLGITVVITGFIVRLILIRRLEIIFRSPLRPSISQVLVLLLPLAAGVQYIRLNTELVNFTIGYELLLLIVVIGVIFIYLIPKIFYRWIDYRASLVSGLTYIFLTVSMADIFAYMVKQDIVSIKMSIRILVLCFSIFSILSFSGKKTIVLISIFYFISLILFGPRSVQTDFADRATLEHERNKKGDVVSENDFSSVYQQKLAIASSVKFYSPYDIYLMIYDAYPNQETMNLYGINNDNQYDYLKQIGFTIYDGVYSVAGTSVETMSRVLSMDSNHPGRWFTSGNRGIVTEVLQNNNYKTAGIFRSRYFLGNEVKRSWNFYSPQDSTDRNFLIQAVIEGEFRFDIFHVIPDREFAKFKYDMISDKSQQPHFLYAHTEYPNHSQNSGQCLPEERDNFQKNLKVANSIMRIDIENIIATKRNSIIIIAGDHGPYLTKNCYALGKQYNVSEIDRLDVQDRYGTFLAIYWPDNLKYASNTRIMILQNALLEVFRALTKDRQKLDGFDVDTHTLGYKEITGGVYVKDGIIHGGKNDGEPLFLKSSNHFSK